jgi:hypothetical protein
MLLGYGGYTCTVAITGQSGSGAAFLTSSSALFDGRTGSGTTLRWTNGTQTTSSYVEFTVTITANPFGEASPRKGVAAFINVQGVPYNLRTVIGGVTQRLRYGPRMELCAWAFPFANGTTCVMRLYNDDGTVTPPIAAAGTIAIGELFVGRVIDLPTLVFSNPSRAPQDPTAFNRSGGGQLWQLMRKPWWQNGAPLGRYTISEAKGGSAGGGVANGGNPAGLIDIQTLAMLLSTTPVCAICDTPFGDSFTTSNGISYDQDFMQGNWLLARPSQMPGPVLDQAPLWSWSPQFQEAS